MFVVRTRPPPLGFPCLGLGKLAVSQPSCFPRVAWQLGTERVLQLNSSSIRNLAPITTQLAACSGFHAFKRTFALPPDIQTKPHFDPRNSVYYCSLKQNGQLNVLHQAASCSSCYDIRDIAINIYS
ncbi:hypothetical protein CSKR_102745 [Clonorchis sinensis]|uniref:Uncharacterized protein n=1 Tax=Clonorchis sinensis TaxID=79923 RepID=A0A3R7GMP9_CLOSI|nr:hypothetical protein CSKR_102745 [Clonorchis sinensis]